MMSGTQNSTSGDPRGKDINRYATASLVTALTSEAIKEEFNIKESVRARLIQCLSIESIEES